MKSKEKQISFNVIYICNECCKEYTTKEEPLKCACGADNFGIIDEE